LDERHVNASINALLALARKGGKEVQKPLLQSLARLADQELTEAQDLEALRVLQLCFIRMGRHDQEMSRAAIKTLSRRYPAKTQDLNRELCQLLVYLESPDVITKTLALMAAAPTQEEQMHYAFVLRNLKSGWTLEQRRIYFSWFNLALREYKGGHSFAPYLVNIRKDAANTLSELERADLASILENRTATPAPLAPARLFVKEWTMSELEPALGEAGQHRSFERGKQSFTAAQCFQCHRMGNDGGSVGPDLTAVASRFNRHDLLENILLPSKVISDRYQSYTITKRYGEEVNGCITDETDEKVVLVVDPMTQQRQEVLKKDIVSREVSKVSQMPEWLLNVLTREEILDLLAYLEADGKPDHSAFARVR